MRSVIKIHMSQYSARAKKNKTDNITCTSKETINKVDQPNQCHQFSVKGALTAGLMNPLHYVFFTLNPEAQKSSTWMYTGTYR